jgi:hypothetical protein
MLYQMEEMLSLCLHQVWNISFSLCRNFPIACTNIVVRSIADAKSTDGTPTLAQTDATGTAEEGEKVLVECEA